MEFIDRGYPTQNGIYVGKKKKGNCSPSILRVDNGREQLLTGTKNTKSAAFDRSFWFYVSSLEDWDNTNKTLEN